MFQSTSGWAQSRPLYMSGKFVSVSYDSWGTKKDQSANVHKQD